MKHKILGRNYTISFVKKIDCSNSLGECSFSERKIRIKKSLKGLKLLDTLCHEAFHGGFDDYNEKIVNKFSRDLAKLLWKLGYRKVEL